eukprot:GFYU01010709.1.p1 GENE.GFYU01010709.1~~GFYU01010709.1.p1  ORF type:complete len:340 (+),score=77.94 GFYU01010709.1:895-1914(+)
MALSGEYFREGIRGIDIGTGASCVYPLLGVRINGWRFLATDIDPVSMQWAEYNASSNHYQEYIECRLSKKGDPPLSQIIRENESYDFCMCNPPFFETESQTHLNTKVVCTGNQNEMITTGGEVAFVTAIIEDSVKLRQRVRWYTTLLGRKASLKPLKKVLQQHNIHNVRTSELFQGRTSRWTLGWSFTDEGKSALAAEAKRKAATVLQQHQDRKAAAMGAPSVSRVQLSDRFETQWRDTAAALLAAVEVALSTLGMTLKTNSQRYTVEATKALGVEDEATVTCEGTPGRSATCPDALVCVVQLFKMSKEKYAVSTEYKKGSQKQMMTDIIREVRAHCKM